MNKSNMLWLASVVNALLLIATGTLWFAVGVIGFLVGALAYDALQRIQDRVVRELSKTCLCPLCKANRGDLPP